MAKHTTTDMTEEPIQKARLHRATYAKDKRFGGYNVRVEGPHANRFAGREVPVTRRDNSETTEKLTDLIWTGEDEKTGNPVALYKFEQKPRAKQDDLPF